MSDVTTVPLRQLCDPDRSITYGIVQPGKLYAGGVPIVRVNNFRGHRLDLTERSYVAPQIEAAYSRSRPRPDDILISLVGSIGQVAIAPSEIEGWNLARAVGLLPARNSHLSRWLYYVLQTPSAQNFIHQHANTTVQATFNLSDLANIPIPFPDEARRKDALGVLSAIDDKIELNRRMNETLAALAQAIFRDWLVDFGPVHRKQGGTSDPVLILGGLLPDPTRAHDVAVLFPDSFGDDGLPKGWAERPFSNLVEIVGGGTPKTSEPDYWSGDIPWFSVVDTPLGSDTFVFQTEKNITPRGLSASSARLIGPGTTIITARGTVGNLAIAAREMTFNQSCYALRSSEGLHPFFTYLAAKQIVERLKSMAHGSVFSTITRQTFESVGLAAPSLEIRQAFEELAAPLFDRIRASVQENLTLAEARDYLLPRLMSGEVCGRETVNLGGAANA
ncbi:restriction endonuclease subunit S [Mesorhizobium sp. M6A.T.Ce.TU.016.01.1.1]|uniref:restriction endonuclease subunit S n=1 Tax=Mesorhizobium sp. M6A.T.Ce.TU.016.01.1.1 TaxID=2496783 RepID=UPI000FCBA6C9|nr:restriction endonuclease subunit S [Mesorhizobium sp. M6A.T.Ce.TU.016.01.1.1]RUU29333.1 restriction endonuclease subunit S [Mesorhizobium sp. M6A.T.Ce.TU.016.01.1.1]